MAAARHGCMPLAGQCLISHRSTIQVPSPYVLWCVSSPFLENPGCNTIKKREAEDTYWTDIPPGLPMHGGKGAGKMRLSPEAVGRKASSFESAQQQQAGAGPMFLGAGAGP